MTNQANILPHKSAPVLTHKMEKHTMSILSSRLVCTCLKRFAASAAFIALPAALTGCGGALGGGGGSTGGSPVLVKYQGNVHGGQQPVSGATIQLYTVGTTGLKSASSAMIASTVKTDANGNFTITGQYDCTTLPATQVYITATGGNPGAGTNNALAMMTALGPCSALGPSTFIQINEVTTIAAAYALAPFAADYTHIGASGSNPAGLVNAFANAAALANSATGTSPGANLPTGSSVPVAEINTLANILAACINTTGSTNAGTPCDTLFSAAGTYGSVPTETFGAALGLVPRAGLPAVTALYALPDATAPFQPGLSVQPKDFTLAINYNASSGGATRFATPYGIAIDAAGNAFVTNESGSSVVALSPQGQLQSTAQYPGMIGPQGIAVDKTGNVWVANTGGNSIVRFANANGQLSGGASFTGVNGPVALAIDGGGGAWVANLNGNSVAHLSSAGAVLGTFTASGNLSVPTSVAIGSTGNVYVTTGGLNGSAVRLAPDGSFVKLITDNALQGPQGIAVDSSSRLFVTGSTTGTAVHGAISLFGSGGDNSPEFSPLESGYSNPTAVAVDNAVAWAVNSVPNGGLSQIGSLFAPAGGFGSLDTPMGVAVDASGCVWTTNSGSNTVSKFIGLAQPVVTPIAANVLPPG